ncbi:MAG: ATP-binding protein [Candidatus Roizmanbacteria bacterium]|nr:ATP-binding protein [Candidatus Roizmanbacteria bacterium]
MNNQKKQFKFKFSLEILNLLGRGLYRSFATVIAEAISNSWDAEATEVHITIGKDKLTVEDNGKGMNVEDFQGKFLEVGYSRRDDKSNKSKRNVIGRKGIGKLAMLSISEKITILSKKDGQEITGGKINNPELDEKIKDKGEYNLENLLDGEKRELFRNNKKNGTKIIFEKFKKKLNNEDIIRKYLATQFNFIFNLKKNDSFNIIVNNKKVTQDDLKELNKNTQFLWFLGESISTIKKRFINLVPSGKDIISGKIISNTEFYFNKEKIKIRGYLASVKTSSDLVLRGSGGDFRAGVNLFTNGRLRQKDLIEDITTKGLAEEYLYGEVHVDGFEDEKIDRFTSSREGIIKDDPLYQEFIKKLKIIIATIIKDWTPWRRENKDDWDVSQGNTPKYVSRLEQSKNAREKDFLNKIDENVQDKTIKKSLKEKLKSLSYKNTMVYQDLFILENIFREYIKIKNIEEKDFDVDIEEEKDILKTFRDLRKKRIDEEATHVLKGKIIKNEHYLNYLNLSELAIIIDFKIDKINKKKKKNQRGRLLDAKEVEPVRNPVMHTTEIRDDVLNWTKIKNVIDYIEQLKVIEEKNKK